MRKDARRNRDAIVAAATDLFAALGVGAPIDVIAQRAGVGNATLYRHFPAREDLLTAVYREPMKEQVAAARRALAHPDPWEGFATYVRETCRLQASNHGLANVLCSHPGAPELARLGDEASDNGSLLLQNAQAAGAVRADLVMEDLAVLLMANAGLIDRAGSAATTASERFIALTLEGWRAEAVTGPAPPPPDREAMKEGMRNLRT
jgi:AcrR family transcriptional regulator